jgi:hypothetical protein
MTDLRALLRAMTLAKVKARLTDRYRPELHYMRGPGPKCAEQARAAGRPPGGPTREGK